MVDKISSITVWRNRLSQKQVELARDLIVYEGVLESVIDKFFSCDRYKRKEQDFIRIMEQIQSIKERLSSGINQRLVDGIGKKVERLQSLLEDDCISGCVAEGQLSLSGTYSIDVVKYDGVWWEERKNKADVQLPKDVAQAVENLSGDDEYATIYIFYEVDKVSGGLKFVRGEVNGVEVPRLLGNLFWKQWGKAIRASHDKLE